LAVLPGSAIEDGTAAFAEVSCSISDVDASPADISGVISIVSDDPTTPTFTFTVAVRLTNGSIPLVSIGDGDGLIHDFNWPSLPFSGMSDNFGTVQLGDFVSHTIVLKNFDAAIENLRFTSSPGVELLGQSGGFTLSTIPDADVLPGANVSFTVTFQPLDFGPVSAGLRISVNDPYERPSYKRSPFTITLSGSGPEIPTTTRIDPTEMPMTTGPTQSRTQTVRSVVGDLRFSR
jgi:hypothetical protein